MCPKEKKKEKSLKKVTTLKLGRCRKLIDLISLANQFEMHFKILTCDIVAKTAVDSDQYIPVSFYYSLALQMLER